MLTIAQRLELHSQPEPNTGCRLWLGALSGSKGSYGHLKVRGRYVKAHRAAWEEANGPIPGDLEVDHCCGQTLCIELTHLRLLDGYTNKMLSNGITAKYMRRKANDGRQAT